MDFKRLKFKTDVLLLADRRVVGGLSQKMMRASGITQCDLGTTFRSLPMLLPRSKVKIVVWDDSLPFGDRLLGGARLDRKSEFIREISPKIGLVFLVGRPVNTDDIPTGARVVVYGEHAMRDLAALVRKRRHSR